MAGRRRRRPLRHETRIMLLALLGGAPAVLLALLLLWSGVHHTSTRLAGSLAAIAGICNRERNIMGLMPHPERASEIELGSADGLVIFQSIVQWLSRRGESGQHETRTEPAALRV